MFTRKEVSDNIAFSDQERFPSGDRSWSLIAAPFSSVGGFVARHYLFVAVDQEPIPDTSTLTPIPARSRKQAMDWSLVLASQDIHPVLSPATDSQSWALWVEPNQYDNALAAIKMYRLENRGWNWRRDLPGSDLEIHWGVGIWCALLIVIHWIISFVWPRLETVGQMSNLAVRSGDWHRLFTAVLLHSDLAHLLANITFGVLILGLAMARFGWGLALLATFMAGAAGNLFGLAVYDRPYTGLGASGMMMGALGLLCIHSIGLWRKSPKSARYILSGIIAGFLIFILFGVDPKSDVLAHLGGFIAGLLFGAILGFFPQNSLDRSLSNFISLTLLVISIIVTWGRAIQPLFTNH